MKITVAGVGYVGLSLAVLLSQHHEVTAITTTEKKAEKLTDRDTGRKAAGPADFSSCSWHRSWAVISAMSVNQN